MRESGRGIGIREIEREREEKSLTLWTQKFINRQNSKESERNKTKNIYSIEKSSDQKCEFCKKNFLKNKNKNKEVKRNN